MKDADRPERPTNGRPWPGTRVVFPATGHRAVVEDYEWWWDSSLFPVRLDHTGGVSQIVSALSVTWKSSVVPISAAAAERISTADTSDSTHTPHTRQGVA